MLLSDKQICAEVKKCGLIDPFFDHKVKAGLSYGLESHGVTLRLDRKFKVANYFMIEIVDPLNQKEQDYSYVETDILLLPPGGRCLAQVMEYLKLPSYLSATLWPKSSYVRCGIVPYLCPIEGGWEGYLTIEISNLNMRNSAKLYAGQGIVQVRFELSEEALNSYEGYYQNLQEPMLCQAKA